MGGKEPAQEPGLGSNAVHLFLAVIMDSLSATSFSLGALPVKQRPWEDSLMGLRCGFTEVIHGGSGAKCPVGFCFCCFISLNPPCSERFRYPCLQMRKQAQRGEVSCPKSHSK